MDAIDITFTMRYYEQHTEGKKQEVAHAISYAYETGRISTKMETAIISNADKFISEIEEKWNGEESTHGVWQTMKEMGF